MLMKIEVMIVEDDLRIAEINSRFTKKIEGFEVISIAETGEQAIELLEIIQPQLVLLDVYLPDMMGTDLVKFIRQNYPAIDIIMMTAASETDIIADALRNGVSDYIVKPVTFERFRQSLLTYHLKYKKLTTNKNLTQDEITSLWNSSHQKTNIDNERESPKGIDPLTLEKIVTYLETLTSGGITAEKLSREIGVSRSTARRYLEHLISRRKVYAELVYGNVGRPERRYFRGLS